MTQIKGDNETKLIVSKDLQSPPIDPENSMTPVCCGSSTNNGNYDANETGIFERNAPGGSFKVLSYVTAIKTFKISTTSNYLNIKSNIFT